MGENASPPPTKPCPLFTIPFSIIVLPNPVTNVTLYNEQRKTWDWVPHFGASLVFDLC